MSSHPPASFETSEFHRRAMDRQVFRRSPKHPHITSVDARILTQLLPDRNGDSFAEVVQALKLAGSENPANDAYCIIGAYAAYSAAAHSQRHQSHPEPSGLKVSGISAVAPSAANQPDLATPIGGNCDMRGALRQLAVRFMASA